MKLSLKYVTFIFLISFFSGIVSVFGQIKPLQLSDPKSFTWIVLPDPQTYQKFARNQALFDLMISWIADQKENLNIQLVLCEGDLVEQNNISKPDYINGDQTSYQQWQSVSRAFSKLDGVLPYIICTGNHDYGIKSAENRYSQFNSYFPLQRNNLTREILVETALNAQEINSLENACYEWISPQGQPFLIFSLEFAPRTEILSWAKELAARPQYQKHTGLLLTHSYIRSSGQLIVHEKYLLSGANYGETIWNELVKLSPNIRFVLCGHVADNETHSGQVGYRIDDNFTGRNVHQMMFNAQREGGGWHGNGGDGWLRILEFLPDQKTLKVYTFSPLFYISPSTRHLSWRQDTFDQFDLTY
ncbi:MAG: metallophosphoesterase [Prolixibacteraceae bacterium]